MKKILINLLSNSMGDTIASIPYVSEYQKKHGGEIYFSTNNFYIDILKDGYPNLILVGRNVDFNYDKKIDIDFDFSQNIQLGYAKQLGFENPKYIKPVILNKKTEKKIKNKYITISVHSTLQCKYWNHPDGKKAQHVQPYWNELCGHLRKLGYTPVVVEKELTWGTHPFFNGVPNKANKKIGLEFNELMSIIEHSEFFIGLSSGLSWVAHAMGKRVALISNFTEDWNEFDLNDENYIRITNKNVCHGCFNKIKVEYDFNPADWYWCPLHKGTERQFECHKSITPEMVLEKIENWLR
jgi:autotransporter strand-loop-strand O-heptosyltransferase